METFNLSEIKAGTVVRKSRSCCLKNKMAELNNKTRKGLPCMGLVFNSVDIEESVISFLTTVSLYSADIKVSPGQNKKINLNTSVIGKISAQPHTTLCIQFLNRANNDKNNTLPLGKQICFTIVWGCTETLPRYYTL